MRTWWIVLGVTFLSGFNAKALPIMNRNSPGAGDVMMFPDSRDPNLYYYAPNTVIQAMDSNNMPMFLYMEYKDLFSRKAIVQATLRPGFHLKNLQDAQARVRMTNPQAAFAALPVIESRMILSSRLQPLVEESNCNHTAGNVMDDQSCTLRLTSRGRMTMLKALRSSGGVLVDFIYKISGVYEDADGHYQMKDYEFNVSGKLGGSELKAFPHLFLDPWGNDVYFSDEDNPVSLD